MSHSNTPASSWNSYVDGLRNLSPDAKFVLRILAEGAALRVPFSGMELGSVVCRYENQPGVPRNSVVFARSENWNDPRRLAIPWSVVEEVLQTGHVGLLTRRRLFNKIGWHECGLDGTRAEFWCLIQ